MQTRPKSRIIMVTGGQRSGKSLFAEELTLMLGARPVYLATAEVRDDEMRRRVDAHRARRGPRWTSVEEPLRISGAPVTAADTVLVDCLTMLASNWFFRLDCNPDAARDAVCGEIGRLTATAATFIFVTNEIGLGGVSDNAMARQFTDLQGSVNQYVASLADEVYLTVSGIPVKIK